ncbi:MAG: recombinase family protein, partial [Acidimicrobiia bacterium]|nr:recombinase family protein [Acidimicrobiia bacterium]
MINDQVRELRAATIASISNSGESGPVRVVGYIRDSLATTATGTAYAQSEAIRRWVAENGHRVVAICQDVKTPGHALGREGLRALVGIIDSGQVDAVIVADLNSFATDLVVQEIVLWDLRARGVSVLSANTDDVAALSDPPGDHTRLLLRDVLVRVAEHQSYFVESTSTAAVIDLNSLDAVGDRREPA